MNDTCLQFAAESDANVSKYRRLITKYCQQLMTRCKYVQQIKGLNGFSGT